MVENDILIIESECEIIRPTIKKTLKIKHLLSENDDINKRIFYDDFSKKKEDLFENLNKSINTENGKNNNLMNCKNSKTEYSIKEILNILSQPIINENSRNRHILQKDLSNLCDLYENNYNEFKNQNIFNYLTNEELYDLNCLFDEEK